MSRLVMLLASVCLASSCSPGTTTVDGGGGGAAGGGALTGGGSGGGALTGGGSGGGAVAGGGPGGGSSAVSCPTSTLATVEVQLNGVRFTAGAMTNHVAVTRLEVPTDGRPARLELAGDAGVWVLLVGPSALPANLVVPGEQLALNARGSETGGIPFLVRKQGFTLANDAGAVAFGASEQGVGLSVPDFSDVGVSVRARGIVCESRGLLFCDRKLHLVGVGVDGGPEVELSPSETKAVGNYDVAVGAFEEPLNAQGGSCDGPGDTRIVGVRVR